METEWEGQAGWRLGEDGHPILSLPFGMIHRGNACEGKQKGRLRAHQDAVLGFPGGAVVKNPPANAGDTGSSPGPGRSHMPWSN